MNFVYYIIKKNDNIIIDMADDMVNAVKKAQQLEGAYLIMQGCIITEIGQDIADLEDKDNDNIDFDNEDDYIETDVVEND